MGGGGGGGGGGGHLHIFDNLLSVYQVHIFTDVLKLMLEHNNNFEKINDSKLEINKNNKQTNKLSSIHNICSQVSTFLVNYSILTLPQRPSGWPV